MTNKKITDETTRSPIDGTELVRLATTGANWKTSLASIVSAFDPLFLTHGLDITTVNPTLGSDPGFRRAALINTTYNDLTSAIGFTDQVSQAIELNFNAGLNVYGVLGGSTRAKYTPVVLDISGNFVGAGEKFVQNWSGTFQSMGDSFLWSGVMTYAGGPIAGDEGQGFTPSFFLEQQNSLVLDTIVTVAHSGYTTTITSNVPASITAQNIPVASTVGAVVGDWVTINNNPATGYSQMAVMQILAINPGVSINGVCPVNINADTGFSIMPALVMTTSNGGFQFGEGRFIVNNSGTTYSTGLVTATNPGNTPTFTGSGTTWTNTMVGGDASNVGAVYLDTDTLTLAPFSVGNPLRSIYQITVVNSTTSIGIDSFSAAGDQLYHGRGESPATNMTYKILPSARVMKIKPVISVGTAWDLVCSYSAHTWTPGNTIECVICPFPDVHGFDFRAAQWNAGGTRREFLGIGNFGARSFETGIFIGTTPGALIGTSAQADAFAFATGVELSNCQVGLSITTAGSTEKSAIEILRSTDIGSAVSWSTGTGAPYIRPNTTNAGLDINGVTGGSNCLIQFVGSSVNEESGRTQQSEVAITGYLGIFTDRPGSVPPFLRLQGNGAGIPNNAVSSGSWDISGPMAGQPNLRFFNYDGSGNQLAIFTLSAGSGVFTGAPGTAVSNTTNVSSAPLGVNASVWNGSAAINQYANMVAIPGSGVNSAPILLRFQIWDNVHNDANNPNFPLDLTTLGLLTFGNASNYSGTDKRATLDPSALTAARTIVLKDTGGDLLVAAANTTGGGSAALGANSPATTNTAPYTWLRMISHDGSTVYVPAWK